MGIKLTNITKKFKNRALFNDFSLNINSGELLFIIGKSGSGKTTLLNIIGQIETIDSGTIEIFNNNQKVENANNIIDYIFQDYNLLSNIKALENIKIGLNSLNKPYDEKDVIIKAKELGLDKNVLYNTKTENISAGEKQRISILRALTRDAKIILADEPTGNLDSKNAKIIFETLKTLSTKRTIIVVSHDEQAAKKYADRIIKIKDGEVVSDKQQTQKIPKEKKIYPPLLKNNVKTSKTKSFFSNSWILFLKDLKTKWFHSILIVITFAISLLSITSVVQFSANSYQVSQNTNINYLQTDLVNVNSKNENYLTKSEINELSSKIEIKKTVSRIWDNEFFKFEYDGQIFKKKLKFQFVDNSNFFKKRFLDKNILGTFIKKENDVVISKEVAIDLDIINPIGKNIYLLNAGEKILLNIVGVNNREDPTNNYLNFVNVSIINKGEKTKLTKLIKDVILLNSIKNTVPIQKKTIQEDTFSTKGIIQIIDHNEQIVFGNKALKENEILISNKLITNKSEWNKIKILNNSKEEEIFVSGFQLPHKVKIVGVFKSDEVALKLRQVDLDKFNTIKKTNHYFYLKNVSDIGNFRDEVKRINPHLEISTQLSALSASVSFITTFLSLILFIISLMLVLITIGFSLSYSRSIIEHKRKDIGILKILGNSNISISFYHFLNIMFTNFVTLLIGFSLYFPLQEIFKIIINNYEVLALNHIWNFQNIVIVWLSISIFNTGIYYLMSTHSFKRTTIKLLR